MAGHAVSEWKMPGTVSELRASIGHFVEHKWTQQAMIFLIAVNAITLGIATTDAKIDFEVLDFIILLLFSIEVLLQLIYRGPFRLTAWNWFDLIVVSMSWGVEVLVLRAIRVLRIVTLSSRLHFIQELLEALVMVAPSLAGILALLLLVLYIYGVLCTSLFSHSPYFARLDHSLFTLFQLMTLENWSSIVTETSTSYAHWWIFCSFMIITSFILYSLVTACVCNAVAEDAFVDHEAQEVLEHLTLRIREIQLRQDWILQQAKRLIEHEVESTIPTSHPKIVTERSLRPTTDKVTTWYSIWLDIRSICRSFVRNRVTQWALIALILLNAVFMGLATFDFVTESDQVSLIFDWIDRCFLIIFTIELVLQLIGHVTTQPYDGWLAFDAVIIVLSWSLEQLQIARAVRILRIVRLSARLETLRKLWLALAEVAPSVSYILAGLVLIVYIFAVLCTVLFSELYEMEVTTQDYFGGLDKTMFTLFQIITMEDWGRIVRETASEYYWAWWLFITFIILTSFVLYSLVVAVICDAVQSGQNLSESEVKKKVRRLSMQVESMTTHQRKLLDLIMSSNMRVSGGNDDGSSASWSSWSGNVVLDDKVSKIHVDHKQYSDETSSFVSFLRNSLFPPK